MDRKYYVITDPTIIAALDERNERHRHAVAELLKFSRRVGGSRTRWAKSGNSYAVVFKNPPDPKLWKLAQNDSAEFWVPKKAKGKQSLSAQFDAIVKLFPSRDEISKTISTEACHYKADGQVMRRYRAMATRLGGKWYAVVPACMTARDGMTRISDMDFEAAGKQDQL